MLSAMALTQPCQGSPEWWNLRFPLHQQHIFVLYPKGQTWETNIPQEKMDVEASLFQMVSGRWEIFSQEQIFHQGKEKDKQDRQVEQKCLKEGG